MPPQPRPSAKLTRRVFSLSAALLLAAMATPRTLPAQRGEDATRPPNVLLIFTDDQGYGDLSCYGNPTIHTPNLDALAAGGMRMTQFYVAAPLCSPSRAALLTGCYPKRITMHKHVIFPQYDYGMHTDEVTIADALRERGYATGCFGKWHLGHRRGLLPTDQGFDVFEGVPFSNDMAQFHRKPNGKYKYRLPWLKGTEVVEWEPDQHYLTQRQTDAAITFIEQHADRPFFCYVPFSMPHIPIYASEAFAGNSPRGLYGDVIEEIDANVGRLVATLEASGVRDDTLILFSSDNGPWLPFKLDGGSAGPLRGGKGTNWEGGQRVPMIANWPGHVPAAAVCREVVTAMDWLPTLAQLCGAELDASRTIDGHDIRSLLLGEAGAKSPTTSFIYYSNQGKLTAIRRGPWKLWLESGELYHVEHDISEQYDVAKAHQDLVVELRELAQARDAEITANQRPTRTISELYFDPLRPR